jgi:MFS family permease
MSKQQAQSRLLPVSEPVPTYGAMSVKDEMRMAWGLKPSTTVGNALDAIPVGRMHGIIVLHVALVRFCVAFADQMSPYVFEGVASEWNLGSEQLGGFGAASSFGSFVGTCLCALLDGRAGRTIAMRMGASMGCLFMLLMGFWAPNFRVLLVLRAAQQCASTLADAAFMIWMQEHLPTVQRGSFYALAILGWPLGKQSMIYIASWLHASHWRLLCLCSASLFALMFISAAVVDDSPRQLVASGQPERALVVLRRMYALNRTPFWYDSLAADPPHSQSATLRGRLRRLCTSEYRGYIGYACCLFSTLGVTTMLLDTCGPLMFRRLLFPTERTLPYGVLMLFNLGDMLGVVASIVVVERAGRRGSLALGFFGQATFLALLVMAWRVGAPPHGVLVPAGMLAAAFRVFHWDGATLWVLEAFPTELRASALSLSNSAMLITATIALASPLTGHAIRDLQPGLFFLLFSGVLFICGIALVVMLPIETRGRQIS